MHEQIDWAKLGAEIGLKASYGEYGCGSDDARRALECIVGEDVLRASVDYYVEHRFGCELARAVLWQLHPFSAMLRCYEIFKSSESCESRRAAVELLRVVADGRAMAWISEFLEDEDALVQVWGIGVLDQLLGSNLIETESAEMLLRTAEQRRNRSVREQAAFIRSYLDSRPGGSESG